MPLTTYTAGEVLTAASLNANFSFAAGGVVQVKNAFITASFAATTTSFVDITGLTISITPTSASNKILVMGSVNSGTANSQQIITQLVRNSTVIGSGVNGSVWNGIMVNPSENYQHMWTTPFMFLDSPATTSATTYKLQMASSSGTSYINRRALDLIFGGSSTITVMEVTP
jgi:hypothetical protein